MGGLEGGRALHYSGEADSPERVNSQVGSRGSTSTGAS